MCKLELLDQKQVTEIYESHMRRDFPPDELKPLKFILQAMEEGYYKPYGLKEDGVLKGYIFLEDAGMISLVDYLAVIPDVRNQGYGSMMLTQLREVVEQERVVFLEIEDPDFAETQAEKEVQLRRQRFYHRNGCRDMETRAVCFGVHYILLQVTEGQLLAKDKAVEVYLDLYRQILPEQMFHGNVSAHILYRK